MARDRRALQGFSLMEVMVVVVIVGILAAVAIPNYRTTIERGYMREADDLLMTIYNGERAYYLNTSKYRALPIGSTMSDWREIYMDTPNISTIPITFRVEANNSTVPPVFTATATRTGCSKTKTINENRVSGGTWTNPASC